MRLALRREEWVVATWCIAGAAGGTGAMLRVLRGGGALCRGALGCNGLLGRFFGGLLVRDRMGQVGCWSGGIGSRCRSLAGSGFDGCGG